MEHTARHLLARHIRWRRFLRGWSQEQLAEKSGIHRTYISALERERVNPGLGAVEQLAHAFSVPVGALLERTLPDEGTSHTREG